MRFVDRVVAVLTLIRWENALLAVAGVMLGAWSATGRATGPATLVMCAVAVLLCAFANADNDVRDREIDRRAHPARPLPAGRLTVGAARTVAGLAAAGSLTLSARLGTGPALATAAVLGAMALYNRGLKVSGLPGNIVVAVVASLPFLFGAWVAGDPAAGGPLLAIAVPLHFAREVAKDIDDARADAAERRTLPLRFGDAAARTIVVCSVGAFVVALAPLAIRRPAFAVLAFPAVLACALAARRVTRGAAGSPRLLKSAMVLAMAAFVFTARG